MSEAPEKVQHELEAAQQVLVELRERFDRQEEAHRAAVEELEKNRRALLFMLEDLEASRKKIEQAHREWVVALDGVKEPIFVHDREFRILRANRAYAERAGLTVQEVIGRHYWEVFPKGEVSHNCFTLVAEAVSGDTRHESNQDEIVLPDGGVLMCHNSVVRNEQGEYLFSVHVMEDITERKRMERALRESEEKFRSISASAHDAIVMMGPDKRVAFWNAAAERMFGYRSEEALGQEVHRLISPSIWHGVFEKSLPMFLATGKGPVVGKVLELNALRKGGEEFPVELAISSMQLDGKWHAIGIVRDITERKRAEEGLRRSEEHYRSLFENMLDGYAHCRMLFENGVPQDFEYLDVNHAFERLTGLKDVVGKKVSEVIPGIHESNPELLQIYGNVAMSGAPERFETYVPALGRWFSVAVYSPAREHFIATFDNVTARKRAEAGLLRANRALKTLSEGNRTLVYARDEKSLLHSMCEILVGSGGYRLAWVGYAWQDADKTIEPMAVCGDGRDYVEGLHFSWGDVPRGQGPTGTAVRSGRTQVMRDMANDPGFALWREAALKYGYASSIALPLRENGIVFGALSVYAAETDAFDVDEVALLEEFADDLAFGVVNVRTRNERDQAVAERQSYLDRLRVGLEQTVQAIAATVEMRDPYTAGHQRRVADLAAAIATQMGLSQEQVRGVHLAGIVHDLGKIHIPAEVLTKPARLNEIEYNFIKTHPQVGYDILKGVEFPWPIAQIVLQHHERLDGSGYPQGLKDGAIILEARILAVADVVEAMASHRPYRAGLGAQSALEEIVKYRGVLYDAQVVDACEALFRDKNYIFES